MVIVLCYHKISDIRNDYNMVNVSIENFKNQMEYLSSNYKMISVKDIFSMVDTEEYCFAVTFDDGYRNVYSSAFPILQELSIPAIDFVTTGNLGTEYENWTDNIIRAIFEPKNQKDYFECRSSELSGRWYTRNIEEKTSFYRKVNYMFRCISAKKRKQYEMLLLKWAGLSAEGRIENRILTDKELKELSQNPLISIGTHSVTHSFLGSLTDNEQEAEITDSIGKLREITGIPIKYMAYPFGSPASYNNITFELMKRNGIEMGFTTSFERITSNTDPYKIPRVVMGNYDLEDFKNIVNNIITKLYRCNIVNTMTLTNEHQLYVGSIEKDFQLLEGKQNIVVWSCGFWGRALYDDLKLLNMKERVVAFGDNDLDKIGQLIEEIPVLAKSDVLDLSKKKDLVILIKNTYDMEIYDDLRESGFRNVHVITK
ncbi:hypothetical protein IMSAGC011_01419 [Lachnospiraceae bacterium]|nr:hypothetical protein IMSAGC011_01419 [Lachnospiraceae bacterium]